MVDLDAFYLKTPDQIRDDILRNYANALIRRGVVNPNVSWGTEIYAKADAFANQLAVASSNTQLMADAVMPDSAQGTDLVRQAKMRGLSLRPAGGSRGYITFAASISTPVLVTTGLPLLDPSGLSYKVSVGGNYTNGQPIPVESIDTGATTNLVAGTILKWVSPPPFALQQQPVSAGGLRFGVDAETYEGLRVRLIEYIRNPPASGNWSHINKTAEDSTVAVQKAFTYAAANGPATVHVAVATAPTATNKNRDLDSTIRTTIVSPAIAALLPEFVELAVTTVQNQQANVSVGLSLPISTAASPAGPGGGWIDGTPFPVFVSQGYANVTAVTSTTQFTVNGDVAPTAGVTHVAWLSPLDWKLYRGVVQSFSGTGPWTITIDQPFVGINTGHLISPDAERLDAYFAALLDAFANLGPGQKTNVAGVLPRAYRKPLVSQSWPSDLGPQVLRKMSDAGDEVLDVQYLYRSVTTPSLPAVITDGPKVLIPFSLALYPL